MTQHIASTRADASFPKGELQDDMSAVLDRNIEALIRKKADDIRKQSQESRIAAAISAFAGSMTFVYLHIAIFGAWILVNLGWLPFIPPFDPTFVALAMIASVEAIFISTFVMINQNRMAALEDKRSELSLQISLLAEHETTRLISMVEAISRHLDAPAAVTDHELEDLKKNMPPEQILAEIEKKQDRD